MPKLDIVSWNYENDDKQLIRVHWHDCKLFEKHYAFGKQKTSVRIFLSVCPLFVIWRCMFLQEPTRPLQSDDQMPLYVLSIQERAEQLASQLEGKPAIPQVKLLPEAHV